MTRIKKQIIHRELSYKITGLLFKTHNELGRYALERHYCDFLEKLLKESGMKYEREKFVSRTGQDKNRVDFIIENAVVLEIKAKPFVTKNDYYQTLRYLEIVNIPLGIITNFRQKYLKPKRILNAKFGSFVQN